MPILEKNKHCIHFICVWVKWYRYRHEKNKVDIAKETKQKNRVINRTTFICLYALRKSLCEDRSDTNSCRVAEAEVLIATRGAELVSLCKNRSLPKPPSSLNENCDMPLFESYYWILWLKCVVSWKKSSLRYETCVKLLSDSRTTSEIYFAISTN